MNDEPASVLLKLPTVNCATCEFRIDSEFAPGQADLDGDFCSIRGAALEEASASVCANHPGHSPELDQIPVGPVIALHDGVVIAQASPDRWSIRQHLVDVVEEIAVRRASDLSFREAAALWQLEQFRERTAFVHLDRIRPALGLDEGEFQLVEHLLTTAGVKGSASVRGGSHQSPHGSASAEDELARSVAARPYRSPHGLGVLTILGLGICAAMGLLGIYAGLRQVEFLRDLAAGAALSGAEIAAHDSFYALANRLQLVCLLGSGLVYLVWIHRASSNQAALGARPVHSPGWAIGAWFVPFLNLKRPYQVVAELWRTSAAAAGAGAPGDAVVGVWWGSWLLCAVVGRIAGRMSRAADHADQDEVIESLLAGTEVYMTADILFLVAALLAALLVFRITKNQVTGHALRAGRASG